MLILTRRKDESIVIGTGADAVVVTLVDIVGLHAKLGIQAPDQVQIDREEVREAKETGETVQTVKERLRVMRIKRERGEG